jgi:hypothetical protein
MGDRRIWFSALRVVGALIVVAAAFQLFFRYQYIGSGLAVMRVDRVTGASCVMPCRPAPASSPSPPSPPNYAEDDQRAIALAQRQANAIAIEAQYVNSGYEWTTEGRYTNGYVEVMGNIFDNDLSNGKVDWQKVKLSTPSEEQPPAPVRVVCFCSKKGSGWRWEVHLDTREVYEVNGNRDLEERYGLH